MTGACDRDAVRSIADAVLYEGYNLYPYRPTATKNRQRWTFGGIFPRTFSTQIGGDPWTMRAEFLVEGGPDARLTVQVRFLQVIAREIHAPRGGGAWETVTLLEIEGRQFRPWEEAVEREIEVTPTALGELVARTQRTAFAFPPSRERENLSDSTGHAVGAVVRAGHGLEGAIVVSAAEVAAGLYRLRVVIENATALTHDECESRARAQAGAFASTHAILRIQRGGFVSLTDPPPHLANEARDCVNEGCWPVLVGVEGDHHTLLASPIILYDYPQIAPESPGDLFDGAEIDEILTLRILTMTEAEKREAAAADPPTRAMLERTEALTEGDMARLHGALRSPGAFPKPTLASLSSGGRNLSVGQRVRVRPKPGGDVWDIVLAGKVAIVEAIERDFEDRVHVAVTIEDDPGRDLGEGRFPGHRFFFSREELEPLDVEVEATP